MTKKTLAAVPRMPHTGQAAAAAAADAAKIDAVLKPVAPAPAAPRPGEEEFRLTEVELLRMAAIGAQLDAARARLDLATTNVNVATQNANMNFAELGKKYTEDGKYVLIPGANGQTVDENGAGKRRLKTIVDKAG